MSALPATQVSYAEYLAFERTAETKHEYVNGQILAMAGGSIEHGRLAMRLGALLLNAVAGRRCEVFSSDVRVRIEATGRSTYPDLSVVCGRVITSPDDPDAITNPSVLVEVLSPTTEASDRGDKWAHYRRLPNLMAYMLVSQSERRIEMYRREGSHWIFEDAVPGQSIRVGGIDVQISVDELYADALSVEDSSA